MYKITRELIEERFDANADEQDWRERVRDVAQSLFGTDDARVQMCVESFDDMMQINNWYDYDIVRDDAVMAVTSACGLDV